MPFILAATTLAVMLPAIAHNVRILHRFDADGVPALLTPLEDTES